MKVLNINPPNFEKIAAKFTLKGLEVFTYGDTIYNPGNGIITSDLEAHEAVHMKEQGEAPAAWWEKYLIDPQFRLNQELKAYREQRRVYMQGPHTRNDIALFTYKLARDLASPMYGNLLSVLEAHKLIV